MLAQVRAALTWVRLVVLERARGGRNGHQDHQGPLCEARRDIGRYQNRLKAIRSTLLYSRGIRRAEQALSEIERLRSEADLHRETSHAMRGALAEIERLQSEVADLQHTKFDGGLRNLSPTLNGH